MNSCFKTLILVFKRRERKKDGKKIQKIKKFKKHSRAFRFSPRKALPTTRWGEEDAFIARAYNNTTMSPLTPFLAKKKEKKVLRAPSGNTNTTNNNIRYELCKRLTH